MAVPAAIAKKFPKATDIDWGVGLVTYFVPRGETGVARAKEYNARKRYLATGTAVEGLTALLWWNVSSGTATLRVHPALFPAFRLIVSHLVNYHGNIVQGCVRLIGDEQGWRLSVMRKPGMALDFRHSLIARMEKYFSEQAKSVQSTKRVAEGDAQVRTSKGKDDILMKQVFPVQVCELKAKTAGGKKEDSELLKGYAPKFVPAADADAAKTKVIAELIKAEKYGDIDDPDVRIQVCVPFGPPAK